MKKPIVVAVVGVMIGLSMPGCGQKNPLPSAEKKATLPVKAEEAKTEEYIAVDPSELDFGIRGIGFSGVPAIGKGGVEVMSGTFDKFLCEGTEIACDTNRIIEGVISTKDYGNIKVSCVTFGGFTVSLTKFQKDKLLKLKKPAVNK